MLMRRDGFMMLARSMQRPSLQPILVETVE
jgi:hypothetical protein